MQAPNIVVLWMPEGAQWANLCHIQPYGFISSYTLDLWISFLFVSESQQGPRQTIRSHARTLKPPQIKKKWQSARAAFFLNVRRYFVCIYAILSRMQDFSRLRRFLRHYHWFIFSNFQWFGHIFFLTTSDTLPLDHTGCPIRQTKWQDCQHFKVVQRGPKGSKMVNLDVFDHLGPFWARLDPFGPFQNPFPK